MYVSVTRTRGPLEQTREVATMVGEEMIPWLRQIDGFEGLLMLSNEEDATTLTMTFWQDRDVAERHRAARMRFRDRVTAAVHVSVEETADFELTFAELGPRLAGSQA